LSAQKWYSANVGSVFAHGETLMLLAGFIRHRAALCIFIFISQMACAGALAASGNDETCIREQAQDYAKSFAAADADKLTAMWDENAVFVDQFGNSFQGKTAIRKQYNEFFEKNGKQPIEISISSLTFPADNMAVEEGICKMSNANSISKYIATHAKRNGKWLMETVTEMPYRAKNNAEYLKALSWLPGDWTVEGKPGLKVKFDWLNENVLSCKADSHPAEGARESHDEFIYWNPLTGCINSFQFDSDGGVARKWWEKSANGWVIHAAAIQADGTRGRADYVLTQSANDSDSFVWQSRRRNLGGIDLPDTEKIKFKKVKS
jgi:uncharacterized protein (TIGR02246 family)